MAIPAIVALIGKIGTAAKGAMASKGGEIVKGIISNPSSSSSGSGGGVFSIPELPKMDGGFYGHTKAGSIPSKNLKGQVTKTPIVADKFTSSKRVPSAKSIKSECK